MRTQSTVDKSLLTAGITTARYGIIANLLSIGRLKFEDYEVENIRPVELEVELNGSARIPSVELKLASRPPARLTAPSSA